MFSKEFDQYIYLNLEKSEEREIFNREYPFKDLLTTLFIYAEKKRTGGKTLIFIDEIQNSPKAIALLRYFHEEAKDLYGIDKNTGGLENLNSNIKVPTPTSIVFIPY
jgi:predicted AAA+ superfamily ATPase